MSALISYPSPDLAKVRPSFIANDESALLASARAGDRSAFENLVMPHWGALVRVTQRILHNREDAEDAVQSAFLDAFRNLKSFQERARFSSWLTRIAMNSALMRLRVSRQKRETSLDEISETAGPISAGFQLAETRSNPEQEYLSNERRVLLEKGVGKLSPLYAEVLHLRCAQQLSAKEISGLLDIPVGTVKARLHRARIQLTRYTRTAAGHSRPLHVRLGRIRSGQHHGWRLDL